MRVTPQEIITAAYLTDAQRSEIAMRRSERWVRAGRAANLDHWLTIDDEILDVVSEVKSYMPETCHDNNWLLTLTKSALWQFLTDCVDKVNAKRAVIKHGFQSIKRQLDALGDEAEDADPFLEIVKYDVNEYYLQKMDMKLPTLEELQKHVFGDERKN